MYSSLIPRPTHMAKVLLVLCVGSVYMSGAETGLNLRLLYGNIISKLHIVEEFEEL